VLLCNGDWEFVWRHPGKYGVWRHIEWLLATDVSEKLLNCMDEMLVLYSQRMVQSVDVAKPKNCYVELLDRERFFVCICV